jgi:hypothetical protein
MQNFFFLAKLCHLVTKKREKKAVQNIQRKFFEKNGPNNPYFEGGKNTKVIIFRQQVPNQ